MADSVPSSIFGLLSDPASVARIVLIVIIVVLLLRTLARVAWVTARACAVMLTLAMALYLLFANPTRISDIPALREAAADAARNLIN